MEDKGACFFYLYLERCSNHWEWSIFFTERKGTLMGAEAGSFPMEEKKWCSNRGEWGIFFNGEGEMVL